MVNKIHVRRNEHLFEKMLQLRRFALAFIHSHSGATGVFRNAFREFVG